MLVSQNSNTVESSNGHLGGFVIYRQAATVFAPLASACGGAKVAAVPILGMRIETPAGVGVVLGIGVGASARFTVRVYRDSNLVTPTPQVTWQSTCACATVDQTGLVRAISIGSAYIKATVSIDGAVLVDSIGTPLPVSTTGG